MARLAFAKKYEQWTIDDWKHVIWSDETKINCIGSDGRVWCWKRPQSELQPQHVQERVKFGGGSIMIWGCMTWNGVGYAAKVDGGVNGELYREILADELMKTVEYYGFETDKVIFQQDNAPAHVAQQTKKWFEVHGISLLDWPAQSPDLNPIENLWSYLKKELCKFEQPASGVHELWSRTQEIWDKISVELCHNLIASMPRRIKAVIKAKGGHTKY
jgi:hypothetical protein